MPTDPEKRLTPEETSGIRLPEREVGSLNEGSGKQWSKRLSWARCQEPAKTQLDTLASHWIEGTLSDGDLALELWEMWSEYRFVTATNPGHERIELPDVDRDIEILVETLLAASKLEGMTPDERRELLEAGREAYGQDSGPGR